MHDHDAAERAIATAPPSWAEGAFGGQPGRSRADGKIARAWGDKEKAKAIFAAARERFNATWKDQKDESYFAQLAFFDAGLGQKGEAIRAAKHAVELLPIAKDSFLGPEFISNLALVYAWTGERDLAIAQLESLARIPFGPSYGDLRFNPCWDSLRGDPRFEKIVASLKPNLPVRPVASR